MSDQALADLENARAQGAIALDGVMIARDEIMKMNPARMTTAEVAKVFTVVVECFNSLAAALLVTDEGLENSINYLRQFRQGLN